MDEKHQDSSGHQAQKPMSPQQNKTLMGVLCYLGILIIVPFAMAKDDPFVKFHLKQGLILVIVELVVWFALQMFLWQLWMLWQLVNLATVIFSILGIVNVINNKMEQLPIIGSLGNSFTF